MIGYGQFALWILPTLLAGLAWVIGARQESRSPRRRALFLLGALVFALLLFTGFILTNPYGRELNSSLAAFAMLPVVVALSVLAVVHSKEIAVLWQSDRLLLSTLLVSILGLLASLWWIEASTFYTVIAAVSLLSAAWLIGTHASQTWLLLISLACLGMVIFASGSFFFTPGTENPAWLRPLMQGLAAIASVLMILLAAAQVYLALNGENPIRWREAAWRFALALLLVAGSTLVIFWDGIWSSAQARAFEDHLPFIHFLLGLAAGLLLTLSLRGARRLAGLAFTLLVSTVAVGALLWGWNTSAFELTAQRAGRVDQAVAAYYLDHQAYPASLEELTPGYLLYLPPPVIVRQGEWCYLGGREGYRLGYVSGDFTYFNANLREEIYAVQGTPPVGRWSCSELINEFESGKRNQ